MNKPQPYTTEQSDPSPGRQRPARGGASISRREAVQRTLAGAAGLLLADCLSPRGLQAAQADSPAAKPATAPATKSKAKAVIQIWMWGGPSHLDTFDPKPEAGNDYCGQFSKPIETNVAGIRICEL